MKKEHRQHPPEGVTLEMMVTALVAHFGWEELGKRIRIRCFTSDPSVKSSLNFLRKTPWARKKVESSYLAIMKKREQLPKTAKHPQKSVSEG